MHTPFGIANLWITGDFATRFVGIILLTCSIVTWVILFNHLWDLRKLRKLMPEVERFWRATSYEDGLHSFSNGSFNPYYKIAKEASSASIHHQSQSTNHRELLQTLNYSEWMARSIKNSIDGVAAQFQKGLTFLGSTGAIAPFVGLFGTVWGIMNSFMSLGNVKQATLAQVAPGIAEALVTTAVGLLTAIPAVIFYNHISRKIEKIEHRSNSFIYASAL